MAHAFFPAIAVPDQTVPLSSALAACLANILAAMGESSICNTPHIMAIVIMRGSRFGMAKRTGIIAAELRESIASDMTLR